MDGTILRIAAAVEALTGAVAIVSPSFVVWILWAIPLTIGGEILGRLAGFALIALGVACWPSSSLRGSVATIRGLLSYNGLTMVLFLVLAFRGSFFGVLFWPALLFHIIMTTLLVLVLWHNRSAALNRVS